MKYILFALILYFAFFKNFWLGIAVLTGGFLYIIYNGMPLFYARKGNNSFRQKNYDLALCYYKKAYETQRASESVLLTYAILLLRQGKTDDAEKIFNLIILSENKKTRPLIKNKAKQYRALLYHKTGRIDEAMEEAIWLFDNYKNTISYGIICYFKLAMGEPLDKVLKLCEEAYEYNSDDRDIADNMAVALINNGEYEKAKEILDKIIENHPTYTEGYYHSAIVYNKLGNNIKAKELLEGIKTNCTRTFLTTVSDEEIEELKRNLR